MATTHVCEDVVLVQNRLGLQEGLEPHVKCERCEQHRRADAGPTETKQQEFNGAG